MQSSVYYSQKKSLKFSPYFISSGGSNLFNVMYNIRTASKCMKYQRRVNQVRYFYHYSIYPVIIYLLLVPSLPVSNSKNSALIRLRTCPYAKTVTTLESPKRTATGECPLKESRIKINIYPLLLSCLYTALWGSHSSCTRTNVLDHINILNTLMYTTIAFIFHDARGYAYYF